MGKNKRKQLECFDEIHNITLSVDSSEECDAIAWFSEAVHEHILNDFQYQPPAFQLFDSEKYIDVTGKSRTLFREHIYTPDFVISFDPRKNLELSREFKITQSQLSSSEVSVYIDVKGTFNKTERSFNLNQKWVFQKFKIFIYKLVPKNFFEKFGCPLKCFFTNKKKTLRKMFSGYKTLKDIFNH